MSESENSNKLTIENYKEKLEQFAKRREKYIDYLSEGKVDAADAITGLLQALGGNELDCQYQNAKGEVASLRAQIERDNQLIESFENSLAAEKEDNQREIDTLNVRIRLLTKKNEEIDLLKEELKSFRTKSIEPAKKNQWILRKNGKQGPLEVDEIIGFGKYFQDEEGKEKTPIEWIVKEVNGSKALLVSRKALEERPYNKEWVDITWEKCTLRSWLNQDFYTTAFSTEEQKLIIETTVTAVRNPKYDTDPGNDTMDKVFLLSIKEAEKYFADDEARGCAPTAYAKAQGAYTNDDYKTAGGEAACWWWLRSPGGSRGGAALVIYDGLVYDYGDRVRSGGDCVRPALWIDLES